MSDTIDHSAAPAAQPPASSTGGWNRWLTPALAGLALVATALFGGIAIGQATASGGSAGPGAIRLGDRGGAIGEGGPGGMAGLVNGTIVSIDDGTIVIEAGDGTRQTVAVGAATAITVTVEGSLADLAVGDNIVVSGDEGSDGSLTATSIRQGGFGGFGGAPQGTPGQTPAGS